MPSTQPFGVSCKGGLNTNLNEFEILSSPGSATKLRNYEVDPDGGYRRINGYINYGDIRDDTTPVDVEIQGLQVYADGVIITAGNKLYFSFTQLDAQGNEVAEFVELPHHTEGHTFTGAQYLDPTHAPTHKTNLGYTDQGRASFTVYDDNVENGRVIICDGVNKPLRITITGYGAFSTRSITIDEITVDGDIAPAVGTVHQGVFVTGGGPDAKNTVYYSSSTDVTSFSTGVEVITDDEVVGIKSFRENIIIFCKNSIFNLSDILATTATALLPITKNVGCLSAQSIQEIGGDLLFLAPDGIRTIAGTARIGDVELSSVSRQIQALISVLASEIDQYKVSSCVIRNKSQYRLFYSKDTEPTLDSRGIVGTLTPNGFEWSETRGIKAYALTSDFDNTGIEKKYHGDDAGYIFYHDKGNYFHQLNNDVPPVLTASNIDAVYETPNFDFGDLGTNKTLDYVRLSVTPEAKATVSMKVTLNSNDVDTPQPLQYDFPTTSKGGIFGIGTFGTSLFGQGETSIMKAFLQGSGYTASFKILTENQESPYTINGFYINYAPSTRR